MPLSKEIEAVIHAKEASRKDRDWTNHHTVLAEGAPAVGWVAVVRMPSITVSTDANEFYVLFSLLSLHHTSRISKNRPSSTGTALSKTGRRSTSVLI